jgi:hypothetical protein
MENTALRDELIAMDAYDQAVRAELAEDGSLFEGYHPRMEAVHRANAARLREILAEFGWPGHSLVGEQGAMAAWRIAQHSIGEPAFMRQCRDLLDAATPQEEAPRWQFAYLDDRIRVYEGRLQRFGTQLREGLKGLEPCPLENAKHVEEWRSEVGLPPLAEILARSRENPPPPPADRAAKEIAELQWRRSVGWISE